MKVTHSSQLAEIVIIEPDVYGDNRGHFLETFQAKRYLDYGIPDRFVQDNLSVSQKGVLRGLHYQLGRSQGKLVWVAKGEIFDVVADIRKGSPTFCKWTGVSLSSECYRQVYVPEGFAHGFCVISEMAIVCYKCTDYYAPKEERGIRWDDETLGIEWPIDSPVLSDKAREYPGLKVLDEEHLPRFEVER